MRYTEFQKCNTCLRGNNFIISVVKQADQNYYLTQCPKCKSFDECKEVTAREAKLFEVKETPPIKNVFDPE